jgi:hypothetical protein
MLFYHYHYGKRGRKELRNERIKKGKKSDEERKNETKERGER